MTAATGGLAVRLPSIEPAQHTAAKVVGYVYLIAMATAIFAEIYARAPLIVRGDAARTAINIAANERLFRIGSVIHLLTFASDAILAVALYVVLRQVNRNVALLATAWRLVDCAILAVNMLNDFAILRLVSGADYLRAFDTKQLQGLVRLFLSIEAAGFQVGFIFLGLGSTVFSYLWLKSRYIPRGVAVWGIFASLVLAIVTLTVLLFPRMGEAIGLTYMAPMFFYEVGLGLWLLIKGLREPIVTN
ncbi:MAG: hypothetical protein QOK37_447 [Thermoanaerobaculia bacterium]|jgi:hypothetical protein|nr:hypothetical protein [Thermoanaerobaculia bacterium]